MADEFFEANGKKIYKKLFENPADYEKLRETFVPGVKIQREQIEQVRAEERKAAIQKMTPVEKAKLVQAEQAEAQKPLATPAAAPTAEAPSVAAPQAPMTQMPQIVVAPVQVPQAAPAPVMPQQVMATTTQTQATKMGKEQKAAYDAFIGAAQEVQKTGVAEQALELEKQKEIGIATQALAEENMLNYADVERERMIRQEKVEKERAKLVAAQEEYKNFQFKDFFEGREGARVLAGISMGLGAIGASITKGPNYAMQIIENAISSDLALQKAKYEKLKGTAEAQQSLYGTLIKAGLEEYQADLTAYNIRAKQGIEKIDAMKSQVTDQQAVAKLDALKAQLQQQIASKQMEATKGLEIKTVTETKPIALPTAKDLAESAKAFDESVKANPQMSEALKWQRAYKRWSAGDKTSVDVLNFVAGEGLNQGSVGEAFVKMLSDAGWPQEKWGELTRLIKGGQSPQVIQNIDQFLKTAAINSASDAAPVLKSFEDMAERVGRPRAYLREQINPVGLARTKAQAAGLVPVRKP